MRSEMHGVSDYFDLVCEPSHHSLMTVGSDIPQHAGSL